MFLAFACHANFTLFQMDFKSVFLNGFIKEGVYVEQSQGFENFHLIMFSNSERLYMI